MRDQAERETRERATGRAERAHMAWRLRPAGQAGAAYRTRHGEVILDRVEAHQDGDLTYLDVWVGGATQGGDPHFRVVNPPLLVQDPGGDVVIRGERFREDPLAALAEVIGGNGGAQARRRRA